MLFSYANADGELDGTNTAFASQVSLASSRFLDLLDKVFVPANAMIPDRNVSTVFARLNVAADTARIISTTTLTKTHVSIRKEQAVDMACDGVPNSDPLCAQARLKVPFDSNRCITRLTAGNTSLGSVFIVNISDNAPSLARYQSAANYSRIHCLLVDPTDEGNGPIHAETDQLPPGDTFSLRFSVWNA